MRRLTFRIIIALCAFVIGVVAASVGGVFRSLTFPAIPGPPIEAALPAPAPSATEIKSEPVAPEQEWNPPTSPRHPAHVIEVGDYHGEEVKARTGEHWLGLYVTNKGTSLSDSILKVTPVVDDMVDYGKPNARTGKRVSVSRRPAPLLLVKGVGALRPGNVSTVFAGNLPLGDATSVDLMLGAKSYNLYVKTATTSYSSAVGINYDDARLILREGEKTEQVLYDLGGKGGATEAYWALLWAGDMDGDGKLDLYVQVSHHYNITQRKLFLSSQAKKGKLLREVAEFATWGC